MDSNESIVTIGMRGDGDEPMSATADIATLERVVGDQRKILTDVTGKDPAAIPQVWALYKEVQEYYDRGMRVPDEVTLLLCDDNWGNLRKLPALTEKPRAGGYGIYYHFDYVGAPRNYKWFNTVQIARVWEQMHLAYEYGARKIWIVNVGDIKPLEYPIQFFLDYAWNPELWPAERLPEYARLWAEQQFGPRYAGDIADILTQYTTYNSRRKPELLSPGTYSLVHYHEAERVVRDFKSLAKKARSLYRMIPTELKDAYYELVLHPVLASANLNELYVTVGRNRLYARQGRAATNALAARAAGLFAEDSILSYFYNRVLADGKWDHMMDQTHISYTGWQQPERDSMPAVKTIKLPEAPEMGVAIEGTECWWPGDTLAALLPEFDPYNRQSCVIEVFNRGKLPFSYTVRVGEPWIRLSERRGKVGEGVRFTVNVDWRLAPAGKHRVPIVVSGPGAEVTIYAAINNPASPERNEVRGFLEANGYVSVEAEHFTEAVSGRGVFWQRIPDCGRTLSAMTPMPVTAPAAIPGGTSPRLEYGMQLFTSGEVKVHAYFSPTLNFRPDTSRPVRGLCYAISFDGDEPKVLPIQSESTADWKYPEVWMQGVSDNIRIVTSRHTLSSPGEHLLKFWMVDPGVVLQKLVVETGALQPSYLGPPESYRVERHGNRMAQKFSNPILAGFYPDPSICRVGSDYYLVTSTFSYFPGLPVFHSKDLVNWELLGHAMDRAGQLNLDGQGVSRGLFAPTIRHNSGVFYITCTLVDIGGNFVITAASPEGPWSAPVWIPEINGIDPSLFFDDDDKAYIVYNSVAPNDRPLYDGHRTIRMRPFDTRTLKVGGEERLLVNGGTDIARKPVWIEAPHILRKDGSYYLLAAEGGTGDQHSEVVFRSLSIEGPYAPYERNPILTQRHLDPGRESPVTSTGHADMVQTESGDWWAVFLACRPYRPSEGGYYNTGRETFLAPVRWEGGWPVIAAGTEEVQYHYGYPEKPSSLPAVRYGGDFSLRDDFDGESLDRGWVFLRTPHEKWYDLTRKQGYLEMKLRPETCSGKLNPSFLGHRQQHLQGEASTALVFSPKAENEKAGLMIFQNENHFYFLCKSLTGKQPVLQLYRSLENAGSANAMELIASRPVDSDGGEEVTLKIEAHGDTYSFLAFHRGKLLLLRERVDARFLSTKVAGGFVGCMYALHATSLGEATKSVAYFNWFAYSGDDGAYRQMRTSTPGRIR
jgi:beta-xylosidase